MSFRLQRTRSLATPGQLELPLDCSRSEPAVLSRNPAPSKERRSRRRQARLAPNPTIHAQRGSVPASTSWEGDTKERRSRQRFVLTPTLSTLITEVNGKRWTSALVTALPPLQSRKEPEPRSGCPAFGRRGARLLPYGSLGVQQRRGVLPQVRLTRLLPALDHQALEVPGL